MGPDWTERVALKLGASTSSGSTGASVGGDAGDGQKQVVVAVDPGRGTGRTTSATIVDHACRLRGSTHHDRGKVT